MLLAIGIFLSLREEGAAMGVTKVGVARQKRPPPISNQSVSNINHHFSENFVVA